MDRDAGGKSGCKKFELLMLSEIKTKCILVQKDPAKRQKGARLQTGNSSELQSRHAKSKSSEGVEVNEGYQEQRPEKASSA